MCSVGIVCVYSKAMHTIFIKVSLKMVAAFRPQDFLCIDFSI